MTRILHLSDTHVSATGPDEDGVDAVASLELMLRDARHVPGLDLVVVSGDVADDGSAEGCTAVRERVARFAAGRGIPHVYSTGNHDSRPGFAAALGSGHLAADGSDRGELMDAARDTRAAVSRVGGLRVVTLDSLVPGRTHGHLDEDQLGWLADLLATPADDGTVVVLHHPPLVPPALSWLRPVVLQDIEALGAVVRGRDVRVILTGHLHFQVSGSLAGVPVQVTPGVVTRIDTTAPTGLVRGVLGAGCTVVDVGGPGELSCHVLAARDPRAGEQVYLFDAATGDDAVEPAAP